MCFVPNIYNDDTNTLETAPGENKSPFSFFNDNYCEEQAFPFLCKVRGSVKAVQLKNNFKETLRGPICEDKGLYSFLKSVKGSSEL